MMTIHPLVVRSQDIQFRLSFYTTHCQATQVELLLLLLIVCRSLSITTIAQTQLSIVCF